MKKLIYIVCALTLAVQTNAQQTDEDLMNLSLEDLFALDLSLGSKTIKNPDQVPGAITTIQKEQIEQMQARSLRDVLNVLVPGMDVVPTYFQYGNPVGEGIYSRGIQSDFNQQILILFNGENKFNESTFGSPYTGMEFSLENVERIEINNSPAPLLGGGALVTINIITKEQNLNGNEVFLNTGISSEEGFQSKRLTLNYGSYINTWHVGASLQYSDDEGEAFSSANIPTINDLRDGTQGAINFQLNIKSPNEKFELGSWYKNVVKDAGFSNLNISQSSNLYNFSTTTFHNYLKYKVNSSLDFSAGVSSFDHSNSFLSDRLVPIGVNQRLSLPLLNSIQNYNYYLKSGYLKDFDFLGSQTLFAGFKIEREGQSSRSQSGFLPFTAGYVDVTEQFRENFGISLPNDDRTIYSLFSESNWNLTEKLSFLYGFRWDNYDNFGGEFISAFNPRLALAYLPTENWIIRALYSSAVRPPSIYEIEGSNFLPQLYGDRNVTFERLTTMELSLKYKKSGFEINVNPFFEKFVDRITYETSALDNTALVASNSGEVDVTGVEVTMQYKWGDGNFAFLNGSKFNSENVVENTSTPFIPDLYINGGLNQKVGKFNFNLTGYYRGSRELPQELVVNTEIAGGSQFIANLATTYYIQEGISAYVLVQNLLDSENFIPLSRDGLYVPLRGQTINLGLNLKF